jgi:hypothetical protein
MAPNRTEKAITFGFSARPTAPPLVAEAKHGFDIKVLFR